MPRIFATFEIGLSMIYNVSKPNTEYFLHLKTKHNDDFLRLKTESPSIPTKKLVWLNISTVSCA